MTQLVFKVELFSLPHRHGVPLPKRKQLEVSCEGFATVLDTLEGLSFHATFVYSDEFKELRPDMLDKAVSLGHNVIRETDFTGGNSKSLGINLSGTTIQHMPNDLYKLLVRLGKDLVLEYAVWSFSDALYESAYRVPSKYYKNCGLKLVQRIASLAVSLKK